MTDPKTTEAPTVSDAVFVKAHCEKQLAEAKRDLAIARKRVRIWEDELRNAQHRLTEAVIASPAAGPVS